MRQGDSKGVDHVAHLMCVWWKGGEGGLKEEVGKEMVKEARGQGSMVVEAVDHTMHLEGLQHTPAVGQPPAC